MKSPRLSVIVSLLLAGAWAASSFGAAASPPPPLTANKPEEIKEASGSKWVFSILPKSLQRKPSVDFNVINEMTPEGKRFPKPTPEKPMYFVAQAGKFTQMGMESPANEIAPPIADLERAMQRALATNSYLPSTDPAIEPRLLVVFNFGSFARFSTAMEESEAEAIAEQAYQEAINRVPPPNPPPDPPQAGQISPDTADQLLPYILADLAKRRDVLERAFMIGGSRFGQQLADVVEREVQHRQIMASSQRLGGPFLAPETDASSPFNQFRNNNEKLMYLVEESFSSCYFVIASAYDYVALQKGKRVLLWRTKMTVNSLGVSMKEALAPLIVSAGPYLGREMNEAATISKRISREGRVEIGTATVVEDNPAPAPKGPANAPSADKKPPPAKP